jgi:hypothetical protein
MVSRAKAYAGTAGAGSAGCCRMTTADSAKDMDAIRLRWARPR